MDETTFVPAIGETLSAFGGVAVLRDSIVFAGSYSGGRGIFEVDAPHVVRALVLPGDLTADGETITEAHSPRGTAEMFAFRGRTATSNVSVFARTASGEVHRLLGLGDRIEGWGVATIGAWAGREHVAIQAGLDGHRPYAVLYRASFPSPAPAVEIPALHASALSATAVLLAVLGSTVLRLRKLRTSLGGRPRLLSSRRGHRDAGSGTGREASREGADGSDRPSATIESS